MMSLTTLTMTTEALVSQCVELLLGFNSAFWQGWHIQKINGGLNNRVYHVTALDCPTNGLPNNLAIKFTIRDARDRAGREFDTLTLLKRLGLSIAPEALWLDRHERQPALAPVIVQEWMAGIVQRDPPDTDAEWHKLLAHLRTIHAITPASAKDADIALKHAVLTFNHAQEGIDAVQWQAQRIPLSEQPSQMNDLIQCMTAIRWSTWPVPALSLCRADTNTLNFIRREADWASVDWEYSGWGDPAFELADLMCMPPYQDVPPARWEWVLTMYTQGNEDAWFTQRVQTYRKLLLVWWVARFARAMYETPRNLDPRLVEPDPGNDAQLRAKFTRYTQRAEQSLTE